MKIQNTMTGNKENFQPIHNNRINLFVTELAAIESLTFEQEVELLLYKY